MLSLQNNWFAEIQDEIGRCKNLSYLNFADNQLSSISESLLSLDNLEFLALSSRLAWDRVEVDQRYSEIVETLKEKGVIIRGA